MNGGASVRLDGVAFAYEAMRFAFDFEVEAGARVAIMGPSGSGKSTLLHLIAGFETPLSGRILIGGQDVTGIDPARRPVSMIFQDNNLFGHLDVEKNVALGRSPSLRLSAEDRADIARALALTGLAGKERRLPQALSGGERQRVALARVFVRNRPVLLLDEPLASLDAPLRAEMLDLLKDFHRRTGMTILMVTHHREDARALCERVIMLESGRIVAEGPSENLLDR
jgi:thiamine transport system ATP-binding protein